MADLSSEGIRGADDQTKDARTWSGDYPCFAGTAWDLQRGFALLRTAICQCLALTKRYQQCRPARRVTLRVAGRRRLDRTRIFVAAKKLLKLWSIATTPSSSMAIFTSLCSFGEGFMLERPVARIISGKHDHAVQHLLSKSALNQGLAAPQS